MLSLLLVLTLAQAGDAPPAGYSIPLIDLAAQSERQMLVERQAGQYLGHPTTILLEDGETMLAVYPRGRGEKVPVLSSGVSPTSGPDQIY